MRMFINCYLVTK